MNIKIKEMFLAEYFRHLAVLGTFCDKTVFNQLAKVFLLPQQDAEALWVEAGQETVVDVVTVEDANQYKRVLQFGTLNNLALPVSKENNDIISIKSNAIAEMFNMGMCAERNSTVSQVLQCLHTHALQGYTSAMYIWGLMQCEGHATLCAEKCFEKGIGNIEKAAHWGYIPAILTMLYFLNNKDQYPANQMELSSKYYQKLLCTFVANSPYRELLSILNIKSSENIPNAQLLLELFAQKKIKSEIFDKSIAKVVYGDTIDVVTKEKLLSDADTKVLYEIAALPMHLLHGICETDAHIFTTLPFADRKAERNDLLGEIGRQGDFFFEQRKPLCICCQDRYVLDAYKRCFERMETDELKQQHVATIDVGELSYDDLQSTAGNVFVTNCKNNARNLYLLILRGNISAEKISAVKNFLQNNKRAKFKLSQPSVTLDLSPIVPLCFCDKQNADKLSGVVYTEMIAPLSVEERQRALKQRIQEIHNRHEKVLLCVNESDINLLSRYPLDIALVALDKLYQKCLRGVSTNEENISLYIEEAEKSNNENRGYGFGG